MSTVLRFISRRPWWFGVLLLTATSILFAQAAGALSMATIVPAFGFSEGAGSHPSVTAGLQSHFARWDASYYLSIARDGYSISGSDRAFYPLYPLLLSGLTRLTGLDLLWGSLLVSALCFAAASLMLYRWVQLDHPAETANWAVAWFCLFPLAFFMIAPYAEPLFLLTAFAALYFARRGSFVAGGLCIALAGATRPFAFLLAIPFIVEFLSQRRFDPPSLARFGAGAAVAPLGTAGYFGYLAARAGSLDLLAIYRSTLVEWKEFFLTWPWITWLDGLRAALFGEGIPSIWFSRVIVLHDLAYAVLGTAIAIWALFNLRPSASAFLVAAMLLFTIDHGPFGYAFWSMPRHVASMPPLYLALAAITIKIPAKFRCLPIGASALGLGLMSMWFVRGGWVS